MANGDFRGQDLGGMLKTPGSRYQAPTVRASTMTSGYEQLKPSIDRLNTLVSDLGGFFAEVAQDSIEEERNNNFTQGISEVDSWFSSLNRDTDPLILETLSNPNKKIAEPFSLIKDSKTNLSPRHEFLFNEEKGILRKERKWVDRTGRARSDSLDDLLGMYSYDDQVANLLKRHIYKKELAYTKEFEAKVSAFQKERSEQNIKYGAERINKGIYGKINDRNLTFNKSPFNKPKITLDEVKDIENNLGMHAWAMDVITHANRQKLNTRMTIAALEERWQEILQKEWDMDYLRLMNNPEGGGANELMKRLIDGYYSLEMPSYTADKNTGEVIDQKIRKKIRLDISHKTNQLSGIKSKVNSTEKLKVENIHKLNQINATSSDSANEIFVGKYWNFNKEEPYYRKYFDDNDLKDTPENRSSLLNISNSALKARTTYDSANKENLIDVKTEEDAEQKIIDYLIGVNKSETGRKTDPFTIYDFGKFNGFARKTLKKWEPVFQDLVLHQDLLVTTGSATFTELNKKIADIRHREKLPLYVDQQLGAVYNDYQKQIQSRKDPNELYRTAGVDISKVPLTKEDYSKVDDLWKARGKEGPAPFPTTLVDGLINNYMPVSGQDDKVRVTTPNQVYSMLKQVEDISGSRSKQLKEQIRKEINETDPLLSSLIFDFVDGPVHLGQETFRKILEYLATPTSDRKKEIKTYGVGQVEPFAVALSAPIMALEGDLKAKGLQLYTHLANAYASSEEGTNKEFISRAIRNFHGSNNPEGLIHTRSPSAGNITFSQREIWGDYYQDESSRINAMQHAMEMMPYKVVTRDQFKSWLHSDKGESLGMGDFRSEVITKALFEGRISNIKMGMMPVPRSQTGMSQVPVVIRINPDHHNGGEVIHTFDELAVSLGTKVNPSEWVLAYGAREYIQYVNGVWEDKSLDYIKDLKSDLENDPSVLERPGINVDFLWGGSVTAFQQGSVGRREIKALEYLINIAETKFKGDKDSGQKAIDYTLKRWGTTFSEFVKDTEELAPWNPDHFKAIYNDKNELILIKEEKDIRTQNIPLLPLT